MRERAATLIGLVLLLLGCGGGGEDSPERLYNSALAALREDHLTEACAAADEAARSGDERVRHLAGFLRGNVAFAEAELAGRQADTPEAEPFAYDHAINRAKAAEERWRDVARTREDWPEARRNVERAQLLVADLERRKEEKKAVRRREAAPDPKLLPDPPPEDGNGTTEEEATPEAQLTALSAEEVADLYRRLAEKEREKVDTRRSHRRSRMSGTEKDW